MSTMTTHAHHPQPTRRDLFDPHTRSRALARIVAALVPSADEAVGFHRLATGVVLEVRAGGTVILERCLPSRMTVQAQVFITTTDNEVAAHIADLQAMADRWIAAAADY